jgi:hypothetical protein
MIPKYLIISMITCVFVVLAGCQQKSMKAEGLTTTAESKTGPKIKFESLVYDFGKVGPRKKLNGEFKFTNAGNAPLKITKVEKCCGAVTELNKNEFAPGESGVLHVEYTSGISAGKITKELYRLKSCFGSIMSLSVLNCDSRTKTPAALILPLLALIINLSQSPVSMQPVVL